MAPSYVSVVLDLYSPEGPEGKPYGRGQACLTPSAALTDVPDMQVIPPSPVIVPFGQGPLPPAAVLLASDNAGPQPAGWSWGISFSVPGLDPWSFYVPAGPAAFTATSANPCVFTWTPAGEVWQLQQLPDGTAVQLSGGSLPGGFHTGATYFVTGSTGDTVQLAATQGGPALGSLSSGGGELTVVQWQLSALAPVEPVTEMAGYATTAYVTSAVAAAEAAALPRTGGTVEGELSPTVTTLTFASTVELGAALGNVFALTMTGACTLASPTGGTDGQVIRLRVTSNGHALTYGAAYQFGSGGQPSLSSSGLDVLAFEFVTALSAWVFLGGGGQGFTS